MHQQFRNIGKDAKMEGGFTRVKQRFDGNGTSNIGGPGEDGREQGDVEANWGQVERHMTIFFPLYFELRHTSEL